MSCLFCQIVSGEIPTEILYETETILVFRDRFPKAPVHMLVIPKAHVTSIMDLTEGSPVAENCFSAIRSVAIKAGLSENGFRVITNVGKDGGQTVNHLHFHVMGGRSFSWPPG